MQHKYSQNRIGKLHNLNLKTIQSKKVKIVYKICLKCFKDLGYNTN